MSQIERTITEFIETQRRRFSNKHNNMFATSISHVMRYRQFLLIIIGRYKEESEIYTRRMKEYLDNIQTGTHNLTAEELETLKKDAELATILHLEIECFYLFAKILLDKVAHFLEFYFGPARNLSFDSHDKLTKNIARYSSERSMILPAEFVATLEKLKKDISDHRDYEIAHEKSPRTIRATSFSFDGKVSIISSQLYPTDPFKQSQTRHLEELLEDIDKYLEVVIEFVVVNKEKTKLEIETESAT